MTCKRGHSEWFLTKLVGKRNRVCQYIMGYRLKNDGTDTLFCCDVKIGEDVPKEYLKLQ